MLNYKEYLLQPLSVHYVDALVQIIYSQPADFTSLFQLLFDPEEKVAWRAAWACQKISENQPEWFSEHQINELITLALVTQHGGLLRGCLSILHNVTLPLPLSVPLINACFEWMISPRYPIAVQAYAMKLLYRICQIEPDLQPELQAYLLNISPQDYSPGFNCTRNNILKKLNIK